MWFSQVGWAEVEGCCRRGLERVIAQYYIDKVMLHCIQSGNNKPWMIAFREGFEKPFCIM